MLCLCSLPQVQVARFYHRRAHVESVSVCFVDGGNPRADVDRHVRSITHVSSRKVASQHTPGLHQSLLTSFIRKPRATDFSNPTLALMCHGLHSFPAVYSSLLYAGTRATSSEAVLEQDARARPLPEPHYRATLQPASGAPKSTPSLSITDGVFRSSACVRVHPDVGSKPPNEITPFENFTCTPCADLLKDANLKRRALSASQPCVDPSTATINLNPGQLEVRVQAYARQITFLQNSLRNAHRALSNVKGAHLTLEQKVTNALRGGTDTKIHVMMRDLCEAYKSGVLAESVPLFNYVADVLQNVLRRPEGHRFSKSTHSIMTSLLVMGGPRCSDIMHFNLHGPSATVAKQYLRANKVSLLPGVAEANFVKLAALFAIIKAKLGLPADYPLPYIFAEDETAILGMIEYCARINAIVGMAGDRSATGEKIHQPLGDHSVHVDPEDLRDYYEGLLALFDNKIVASYLRVIVVAPLHAGFPMLPIVVEETDNTFTRMEVLREWKLVNELAAKHLLPVFRTLPLGNASDGDQRRSMLQLYLMLNTESKTNPLLPTAHNGPDNEFGLDWHGVRLRCYQKSDGTVSGMHMQDFIHDIKKLYNGCFSPTRFLLIGEGVASHESILAALQYMHSHQLTDMLQINITVEELKHYDKQNFATVLRLSSLSVQKLLRDHHARTQTAGSLSTALYLDLIWKVMMVFTSKKYTVEERINLAGYCISFVALWMHDLETRNMDVSDATAFLTIQSCRDIILSLNTVVLFAVYFQEMNVRLAAKGMALWDFNIIQRFSSEVSV